MQTWFCTNGRSNENYVLVWLLGL